MIVFTLLLAPAVDGLGTQTLPVAAESRRVEDEIAAAINQYRMSLGLKPVPRSSSLDAVAQSHVADLFANRPDSANAANGSRCNTHSWSARGRWTPVCYTDDHAQAERMWSKPAEITEGRYTGKGFEIAMSSSGPAISAAQALAGWRASVAHEGVIAQRGVWAKHPWRAMGVGVGAYYAVVWFGEQPERTGR